MRTYERIVVLLLCFASGATAAHAAPTMKFGESKTWSLKNGVTVMHTRHHPQAATRVTTNASGDRKTTVGISKNGTIKVVEWTQPSGRKLEFVRYQNRVLGQTAFLKDLKARKSINVTVAPK